MANVNNNQCQKVTQDLNQQLEKPPSYISPYENAEISYISGTAPGMETPIISTQIAPSTSTIPNALYTMPMVNMNPPVGARSTELICPQCRCRIKTRVSHRSTARTHIACLLLSWSCCCCCLPYCMDSCRNADHYCPMCGVFIGTYQS